jgi:hypothetical protein
MRALSTRKYGTLCCCVSFIIINTTISISFNKIYGKINNVNINFWRTFSEHLLCRKRSAQLETLRPRCETPYSTACIPLWMTYSKNTNQRYLAMMLIRWVTERVVRFMIPTVVAHHLTLEMIADVFLRMSQMWIQFLSVSSSISRVCVGFCNVGFGNMGTYIYCVF